MSGAPETRSRSWIAGAERAALACMALGLALMLLVRAGWAFRAGFFVVLGATAAHIVCSHGRGGSA